MNANHHYGYVIRDHCGCITYAAADDVPSLREEIAEKIAGAIQGGFVVERLSVERIRKSKWTFDCRHKKAALR